MAGLGRTGLIVAGMHRSGTSAVARMINLLGADMARDIEPANAWNDLGYWEPKSVVALHDRMLRQYDASWNSLSDIGAEAAGSPDHIADIKAVILEQYGESRFFVVKDPRLCLFIAPWCQALAELEIEAKFVLPFRDPLAVAQSLRDRQAMLVPGEIWSLERGGLLWLHYNLAAEAATRGQARAFLSYDRLLDNWRAEAARIEAALNIAWPVRTRATEIEIDALLRPSMRHHGAEDGGLGRGGPWSALIRPVYEQLCAMAADPNGDTALFAAARAQFKSARALFTGYIESYERHSIGGILAPMREPVATTGAFAQIETALAQERSEVRRLRAAFVTAQAGRLAIEAALAARPYRQAEEVADLQARLDWQDGEIIRLRDRLIWLESIEQSRFWRASGPLRGALTRHPRLARSLRRLLGLS